MKARPALTPVDPRARFHVEVAAECLERAQTATDPMRGRGFRSEATAHMRIAESIDVRAVIWLPDYPRLEAELLAEAGYLTTEQAPWTYPHELAALFPNTNRRTRA